MKLKTRVESRSYQIQQQQIAPISEVKGALLYPVLSKPLTMQKDKAIFKASVLFISFFIS